MSGAHLTVDGVCGGRVVTPDDVLDPGCVHIGDGQITFVGPTPARGNAGRCPRGGLGAADWYVLPGFVDQHVHGGGGGDFGVADSASHESALRFHAQHGTTSLLPTLASAAPERLQRLVAVLAHTLSNGPGDRARTLGIHLEGPWINQQKRGAHDVAAIRPPDQDELRRLVDTAQGDLRMLTIAPEVSGVLELVRAARRAGIEVNVGHTLATYAQVAAAVDAGVAGITHIFNAMSGLHHREPGAVGAAMMLPELWCEVIADGRHVSPVALQILHAAAGADRLVLVTDAVAPAGRADGRHVFQGRDVVVHEGLVTLAESDVLAGSTLTMDEALRRCMEMLGVDITVAARMASANPAQRLGRHDIGRLEVGRLADLVVLDEQLRVVATIVGGRVVHDARTFADATGSDQRREHRWRS